MPYIARQFFSRKNKLENERANSVVRFVFLYLSIFSIFRSEIKEKDNDGRRMRWKRRCAPINVM